MTQHRCHTLSQASVGPRNKQVRVLTSMVVALGLFLFSATCNSSNDDPGRMAAPASQQRAITPRESSIKR
eukprot:354857-Chlamydomonas_euryale.AAC.40